MITIASDALAATLNPLGAELWGLADGEGRSLMTDADPAFWTGHAPILFPIVGGLRNDRYRLRDGHEYSLPRHGFARTSRFEVVEQDSGQALFRLTDNAATRAAWPFAFQLDIAYRVMDATLSISTTVANSGDAAMPFSYGHHPAFAWPLPYGATKDAHRILFGADEPEPIRRLDPAGQILPDPAPSPVRGRELVPADAMFVDDALIWDKLASRSLTWGAPGTPALRVDYPDFPMLGIWQKPGAAYLCIEPWAGIADPVGYDGAFEDKPGMLSLPPGEARSFRMDVTLVQG